MAQMTRDDIDLLDGDWYAGRPYEQWAWMRENAPVYCDERNDVWGITLYDDVLTIEKDAKTFSSKRAPRPHGDPLPMMISMDNPEHQQRRSLVYRGFTPKRVQDHTPRIRRAVHADHRQGVREGRVRLRVGHRRPAPPAADRRHARLPARRPSTTC